MPLVTDVQRGNTACHEEKEAWLKQAPISLSRHRVIRVYNREVRRKEKPPYSKELPHFSEGELLFSAIAEGHDDKPGKAQDAT